VETYLQLARELQPELIVLGMGMPKQELVAARLVAVAGPCLIVCGGAILDFLGEGWSGPQPGYDGWAWWLYRLLKEPRRLFGVMYWVTPVCVAHPGLQQGAWFSRFRCAGQRAPDPSQWRARRSDGAVLLQ
jgi:UDP-N-acetyl-D-mannosaminuronic acid transferase (WecB/TagA/CpsF family)